jgi:hypothetical protein
LLHALVFAGVVSLLPVRAIAIVHTEIVVLLGAEAPASVPEAAVRAGGLVEFTIPSMTRGSDVRPLRRYVGRVLARVELSWGGPQAASVPVPTAADQAEVRAALGRLGLREEPHVIAFTYSSGGR